MSTKALPKVSEVEKESLYGYVHGVSGPGELSNSERACNKLLITGKSKVSIVALET